MKINRKLFYRSWLTFLIYFIVYFPLDLFLRNDGRDWRESLIMAFFNGLVFTMLMRYVILARTQIYFKLSNYDELMKKLDNLGAEFIKVKGDKHYYKIKYSNWINKRIVIKKTPFYLYADVPEKLVDQFLQLRDLEEKAG